LSLIGQLGWPAVTLWWRLPSSGTVALDRFESHSIAEQVLIALPASYPNRESWPLVVFLHGSGDRGIDPTKVRDCGVLRRGLPAIVIAPQCLPSIGWEPDAIAGLVEHVSSKYRVDRNRLYLIGYSMGGYGTWRTAVSYPKLFAAIVPICGGGDPQQAKEIINVPVWAFHGEKDDVVPVAASQRMIDAIQHLGGHPKLTIIPDGGHGIGDSVLRGDDLWQWLFNQTR